MSHTPPHFETLEKMEQVDIPGLVEMMRQEGTVGRQDEPDDPPSGMDLRAKTAKASERNEAPRSAWRGRVSKLDPSRLVFVDECGTKAGRAPLRMRAPRGERAHAKVPRSRGETTTLMASMSFEKMEPSLAVQGGTNKAVRGPRRAGLGALLEARAGGGDGQPAGPQVRGGARVDRG